MLNLSRKFSIDLSPNIFYSRGQFIELLISSEVSKYCEFRLVNQILTKNLEKNIEKVIFYIIKYDIKYINFWSDNRYQHLDQKCSKQINYQ